MLGDDSSILSISVALSHVSKSNAHLQVPVYIHGGCAEVLPVGHRTVYSGHSFGFSSTGWYVLDGCLKCSAG